jgi:hypothetical protein
VITPTKTKAGFYLGGETDVKICAWTGKTRGAIGFALIFFGYFLCIKTKKVMIVKVGVGKNRVS